MPFPIPLDPKNVASPSKTRVPKFSMAIRIGEHRDRTNENELTSLINWVPNKNNTTPFPENPFFNMYLIYADEKISFSSKHNMDPVFLQETRRLQQFRQGFADRNTLESEGERERERSSGGSRSSKDDLFMQHRNEERGAETQLKDPLIFPGLYAPSGFDMMGILIRVRTRPNPKIAIGNVDSSVALVVCDTSLPNLPIVYYSEPFSILTGYSESEIMGKNCRFLQYPCPETHAHVSSYQPEQMQMGEEINRQCRIDLKKSFEEGEEARVRLINYTKGGKRFVNILTTIPITWDEGGSNSGSGKRYIVGFQADEQKLFGT